MISWDSLIRDKVHPLDISQILGLHINVVRRKLPKGYSPNDRLETPFGLTSSSISFRMWLANILIDMSDSGLSRQQISNITGLNKHESHRAERRPFNHDWTISQIERTLEWRNNDNNT